MRTFLMGIVLSLFLSSLAVAEDVLVGIASWYGPRFHGKTTASGQIYDMYGMTAAHRKLPLGTVVCIENTLNGKNVIVTINDRGPYVDGRIIDVSYGVAQKLDMVEKGLVPVKVRIMK
jgi:rare lipoprotein A